MPDLRGLEYYEVGGAVRDELLNREPSDRDFVVVGATPEEMEQRGFTNMVGESFPVFLHPETKDEWALARAEEKTSTGYKGFEVNSSPSISLEEDLERRDLTINAMAKNPETGEITDPFGGQEDLESGVVRHVSEAFAEDPLRVIRAARFAARFDFIVADDTLAMMESVAPELAEISAERLSDEIMKALRQADRPRKFFDVLHEAGALDVFLPELGELNSVPAGASTDHNERSAFEHTMRVVEAAHNTRPNDERLLLAAVFHDIGKSQTPPSELPSHPNHGAAGKSVAQEIAERLEMTNEQRGVMKTAASMHEVLHRIEELAAEDLINMTDRLRDNYSVSNPGDEAVVTHLTPDELVDLVAADAAGREPSLSFDATLAQSRFEAAKEALESVSGEELLDQDGVSPGEEFGQELLAKRAEVFRESDPASS